MSAVKKHFPTVSQ